MEKEDLGTFCANCGANLLPGETVFEQASGKEVKMPKDGSQYETRVLCIDCA